MLKTILITFTTTTGALALAANLFLKTILGMFGLAATSVETLSQLRASHKCTMATSLGASMPMPT